MMPLQKYAQFTGRSGRAEFWWYCLALLILNLVVQTVDQMISGGPGILTGLVSLALFIPGLAVAFRRLHDTDRSAWWLLISFVPLIGFIVLIVFWASAGTPGPNRFGEAPAAAPTA
ncbi:MAG: DUF805 domain-containing protein [Caulobacterales bacterium]|nr:DUF805 domain-containing protein [Caulobacterales bacterium]